jgi:hypothetical protein
VLCRGVLSAIRQSKWLAKAFQSGYFTMQSLRVSNMENLNKALAEIDAIRGQMARAAKFRGYGPATLAATGALALLSATAQSHWLKSPGREIGLYLAVWISIAAVSVLLIGTETIARAQRVHLGLAKEMIHSAAEQFLPALVAGLLLTVVLVRYAPQSLWMLPGLWQVVFSLGVFSSCQFLPRPIFAVGVWYLAAGLTCLALGNGEWALSPWEMGIPFGVGQLLVAAVLYYGEGDDQP